MNELSSKYFCQVDFYYFNVDQPGAADALEAVDMRTRSTYALLTSDGTEQIRWLGPIQLEAVAAQFDLLVE